MSDWQPIETAPRNGARVLAYWPRLGRPVIARCGHRFPDKWSADIASTVGGVMADEPALWMPLPEPPVRP